MTKCIFGVQINIKVFYKLILPFWVCVARHAESTQNKFAYFYNISRKMWGMKVIFCMQINIIFLQVDIITLNVHRQTYPKYPKRISLQYLCNILRKTWRMKLIFCLQTNIRGFFNPTSIYLHKVNSRNTRTRCEICSKLTIKTPEQCQRHHSGALIVNFEHISLLVLLFLLLTLNM